MLPVTFNSKKLLVKLCASSNLSYSFVFISIIFLHSLSLTCNDSFSTLNFSQFNEFSCSILLLFILTILSSLLMLSTLSSKLLSVCYTSEFSVFSEFVSSIFLSNSIFASFNSILTLE